MDQTSDCEDRHRQVFNRLLLLTGYSAKEVATQAGIHESRFSRFRSQKLDLEAGEFFRLLETCPKDLRDGFWESFRGLNNWRSKVNFLMNSENLKSARETISHLSPEEKALLFQEIGSSLGCQVMLGGGNFISAEIVLQIQSHSVDLSEVLKTLANRLSK